MNIGHIPKKIARVNPDRDALIDVINDRRISFGELDRRVDALAAAMIGQFGLSKGDRVAILAKNCIQYMEVFYAAAASGLIVMPLNWRLSEAEMLRVLADGEPALVVAAEEYRAEVASLQASAACRQWLIFSQQQNCEYEAVIASATAPAAMAVQVEPSDPMLILYTGGTTGQSKGALHTHYSVFMGMVNQTVAERILPTDIYMLTGQMFHIPIALAINYMAHGCPLVLINFEAKLALEVIQRERVTAFLGITTMINWMMAVDNFEQYDLSSLRNFQYGGGPMPPAVVEAAMRAFPGTIIQGYGQTEGVTMSFLSQEDHQRAIAGDHPQRLASCGRAGFVTDLQVVDPEGVAVPKDSTTAGEVIVKSGANMVGYWRRPELTAQTLRDGWMWTGDIAVWDEEGYVYIVDRAKDMIISGGENIYSTQVESALHQHPAVLEAAVFGVPDDVWGESVKAVVVLKPGAPASEEELIAEASRHLASYQKPKSIDFVAELPKAPTGKILKRVLRDPYWKESGRGV